MTSIMLIIGCHSDSREQNAERCARHYKAESYKVALKNCEAAAAEGHLNSQWILANIYMLGLIDDNKDYKKAYDFLFQAADNGHTAAQRELGKLYLWGRGTERNVDSALMWLKLAARQKDTDAQFLIGVIYLGNKDHKGDQASALNWFKKAAGKGHKTAINNMAWIYATSTNKSLRKGKQGVKLMAPLVEKYPESFVYLDTYAAALAEAEEFEQAVEQQQKAISLLPETMKASVRQGYIDRLNAYKNNQPW